MASFQTSQHIDTLTVNTIYTKGANNTNIPAFRVLTTDGEGGTMWMTLSSLQYGAAFHTIKTSAGSYTADQATNATFSLLDGPNVGIINDPTASNTAYLYAKAFAQFDISGGNSINCFDPITNTVNNNVLLVGTGGINIKADPQTNTMFFDGRELPFVSSLPYAFNQAVVYSNVPLNTRQASTNKSIVLQAQGPSSILSFVGEDLIVIETDYRTNQIKFKVSTIDAPLLSTIINSQKILFSTALTRNDLSSFSTTIGSIITYDNLQDNLSSMSTSINTTIQYNSTVVGDLSRFSKAISTVFFKANSQQYINNLSTSSNIVSTSKSLESKIDIINYTLSNNYNTIIASTILTPAFNVSTIVNLVNSSPEPIVTPFPLIQPMNFTYLPLYSSFYNVFNDTQSFGSPIKPPTFNTSIDITSGNTTVSTISTIDGKLYSSFFSLQGKFVFYPNNEPHPFSVKWSGNLALNINGRDCLTLPKAYPRLEEFSNNAVFNSNITGYPITVVNFVYTKLNNNDYLTFSNFKDYVAGGDSYNAAPIYQAYGYDIRDTPLYTETINNYPAYFSSPANLVNSPYQSLSSYVIVASTFYTSGANTAFPIEANGFTSISFLETASQKPAIAVNPSIFSTPNAFTSNIGFSASNAFGYSFKNPNPNPNSPYFINLIYGHQNADEYLRISTLYRNNLEYEYLNNVNITSLLTTTNISSYNTNVNILNISTMNGLPYNQLQFRDSSSISTVYTGLNTVANNISTGIKGFAEFIDTHVYSESTISTTYNGIQGLISSLNTSIINYSNSPNPNIASESTISTAYYGIQGLLSSLSTTIVNYNNTASPYLTSESTISTALFGINGLICSLSTSLTNYSTSLLDHDATSKIIISTTAGGVNNIISCMSTNINEYGNSVIGISTISIYETYTSTLYTSSVILSGSKQPFIQYGTASISPNLQITLPKSYVDTNYAIQLTYSNDAQPTEPIFTSNVRSNSFYVTGNINANFYWTTLGNIF